jgi:hypothetical protein
MIEFYSENLKSYPLFLQIGNRLKLFQENNFENMWNLFVSYATKMKRVVGNVSFRKDVGNINVMGIRFNDEVSFNLGPTYYNDILIVSQNKTNALFPSFYIYKVTMDPKNKTDKIAHLLLGVYNSYVVRPHKWIPSRTALCQDINNVFIARTDAYGNVINAVPYSGIFGINIHDAGGFINSSIGCTILERDSLDNGYHYVKSFKPLLKTVSNKKDVVYCVTSIKLLEEIYYTYILKQDLEKNRLPNFRIPVSPPLNWWSKFTLKRGW